MKIKYLPLLVSVSTVLCSLTLVSPAVSQSVTSCVSSTSDFDGDGFGTELSQTCVVDATTSSSLFCAPRVVVPISESTSSLIADWDSARELMFLPDRIVEDPDLEYSYWDTILIREVTILNLYDSQFQPEDALTKYGTSNYISDFIECFPAVPTFSERTPIQQAISEPNDIPTCELAASDNALDGYGFENDAICIVSQTDLGQCENRGDFPWGWNPLTLTSCRLDESTTTATTNVTGQCENRGGFPWGWNPVTLSSCRLDEQTIGGETPTGAGVCLDPDGDGFGWNGVATCLLEVPVGQCIDSDGDGFGWDGVASCIP